jgi:DNA-binding NtrC family response regulator
MVSVLRNTAHGFRLVCSTTEDLEKMVDAGNFNDELFYRVASLPLAMPPLRDRKEDIPLLVKHFCVRATNPLVDTNVIEFTDDAMAVLTAYHWPGNLTEMFQLVSKIASTTETRVMTSEQLPLRLRQVESWPTLAEFTAGQEKQYMDRVLHACRGDKAAAAKVLGIDAARLG